MVMAPPGGDFETRALASAQPDIDLAKRQQYDQERAALQQWAQAQQLALEQERMGLEQYKTQLQQQLASIEQSLDRGARMAANPHTQGYARGGIVPHFNQGGATDPVVATAPNGVPIRQNRNGQLYYIDSQGAVALVPPQFLAQLLGQAGAAPAFGSQGSHAPESAPGPGTLQGKPPAQTSLTGPAPGAATQKLPGAVSTVNANLAARAPSSTTPAALGNFSSSTITSDTGAGAPPLPPGGGLVAPTPDQWSPEFRAALAARDAAQAQAAREQGQSFAYGQARERELPTYNPRAFAGGGEVDDPLAGPPMPPGGGPQSMPPGGGPGNAVTGEGMDGDGTFGGEVVLVPTGEPGTYRASYSEGPKVSSLPGGSLIVPLPPHLDEQFRNELPPLPGAPAEPTPDGGYAAGGQVYATGGMVPPGLPPLPPVSPFAGIQPASVPQNLQQFTGLSQMQQTRLNQGMNAGGDLEGLEGQRRRLLNTAPGVSGLNQWSG